METILALAVAMAAQITPPTAGLRQFGVIVYTPPPGWEDGADDDGILRFYSDYADDRCEYCYLYLATAEPFSGPLTDWLRTGARRLLDEDAGPIEIVSGPEMLTMGAYDAAFIGFREDDDVWFVAAVDTGGQAALIGFEGYGWDEDDLADSLETLQSDVLPFWETLRFLSPSEAGLLPLPVPGDLSGLYWHWDTSFTLGIDGMMQATIDHETLMFWPDGQFYDGTPPTGTAPLDRAALMAAGDTRFGNYAERAGQLHLTYASGETALLRYDRATGGWTNDDEDDWLPVTPLADGTRLSGDISSFYFSGFAGGMEGGISGGSSTTFHPDGTYDGDSFGGAFGSFDTGGGFATSSEGATGGTYEVRDGLLIMYPTGGPPTYELAFDTGDGILIGEEYLGTE